MWRAGGRVFRARLRGCPGIGLEPERTVRSARNAGDILKISGDQVIRTSASANIEFGRGGTYQVPIGIERAQKARFIEAGIGLDAPQRIFVYEKRCFNGAIVSPKTHGTSCQVIGTTAIWEINHA